VFQSPTDGSRSFSLVRPFVPFSEDDRSQQLQAVMTASGDPKTYGKLTAYVVTGTLPDGPSRVDASINDRFASQLTVENANGSRVQFGTMQLVPVGKGLVYVRPWYAESTNQTNAIAEMRYVAVTAAGESDRAPSIGAALNLLFPDTNIDAQDRVDANGNPVEPENSTGNGNGSGNGSGDGTDDGTANNGGGAETADQLIADANRLYQEAQDAQANFDSKTYQQKMQQAYSKLQQATQLLGGVPTTTIPGTGPPPTAPPTTGST
jgi:uncharacterized membrane protein (UPF0182 family)